MKINKPKLQLGDYNVICDYSGFKVPASECIMTWDGFFVHRKYWESRHPQDFVKGVRDQQTIPVARPESTDVFLTSNQVSRDDL